jgi:deoxyadenosine/deoxycytidine kinase
VTELVFIEGVLGVGKSTMVHMLTDELKSLGYAVKEYLEFDYTNPVDFYCTA